MIISENELEFQIMYLLVLYFKIDFQYSYLPETVETISNLWTLLLYAHPI